MLNDHLSLLEKYSILISYLLKNSRIFPRLYQMFLPQDFSRPKILFDHFPGFQAFPVCVGNLDGRALQYPSLSIIRQLCALVFHQEKHYLGVDFVVLLVL